jgi:hypothetical protein
MTPQSSRRSDFRALTSFEKLDGPAHKTFLVSDDLSAPHLRPDEYAVVDTTDRELQHGELYLVEYDSGSRRIVQVRKDDQIEFLGAPGPGWWVSPLRRLPSPEAMTAIQKAASKRGEIAVFEGLSEGPLTTDYLQRILLGRVVGIANSSLGVLIDPSVPVSDEEYANKTFDPARYIDDLLSLDRKLFVLQQGDRDWLVELPQRRALTARERSMWFAACEKFNRASSGADQVTAECIRRGMVRTSLGQS